MTARIYPISRAVEKKARELNALLEEHSGKVIRLTDAQHRLQQAYIDICHESDLATANLFLSNLINGGISEK